MKQKFGSILLGFNNVLVKNKQISVFYTHITLKKTYLVHNRSYISIRNF